MKRILTLFLFVCMAAFVFANNGNNSNSTNNDNASIDVVKQEGTADPYASSLETIPGCQGPKDPDRVCTREYAPVCGCDGKTYSNACMAIKEGILIFVPGECGSTQVIDCYDPAQANPAATCTLIYAPVCACGVLTFPNACEAQRYGFINTTPGPCPTPGQ